MSLRHDAEPLKIVPQAQREVWEQKSENRCAWEDARGRCRRYDTRLFRTTFGDARQPEVEWLCPRHAPRGS